MVSLTMVFEMDEMGLNVKIDANKTFSCLNDNVKDKKLNLKRLF
jgi:hypothetical protein